MTVNNKNASRWSPYLQIASLLLSNLLFAAAGHAEVHSFSIDQLKHTSSTLPNGAQPPALSSPSDVPEMPAAVPYTSLQMPPLPKPSKVRVHPTTASARTVTTPSTTITVSQTAPVAAKVINAATCRASLKYSAELALNTYQQHADKSYMALVAAATLADDNVSAGFLPNMAPYSRAADDLPWFFAPNHDALQQATQATELACIPPVSN